ncbi:uncharacterized protein LOC111334894 isoform X1 [Stylophora pistillata]|uniref:uncharacterized protein LOC111334894 isoform X1 n=1 Tax=Stylophora pistillata TaxID=50429 RepID=UPI000C04AD5E|nr:uncharacterized protein LOC111334894 isoform X1 [Stylophora pistillata]
MSSYLSCHDPRRSLGGDTNKTQDASKSSSNSFISIGHLQQAYKENSESTECRSDPIWNEVAKRYQEIIEKEYKMLGQYYDDQMVTQSTNGTSKVFARVLLNGHDGLQSQGKDLSCKQTETRAETGNGTTEVYDCTSSVIKKTKDTKVLPKILDVYSLNSTKISNKTTGVVSFRGFRLNEGDRDEFSLEHGETAKKVVQNPNLCLPSSGKKSPSPPDQIIDLTIDDDEEEEEQTVVDKGSDKIYENISWTNSISANQSQHDESKEKIQTADEEKDIATKTEYSQNKRKGGGKYNKKRKRRCPAIYRDSLNKCDAEGCNNDRDLCHCSNNSEVDIRSDGDKQKLWDQNNISRSIKDEISQITEERDQTLISSGVVHGASGVLDLSYRASKITTLKARLAKQEEELARLRSQKERLHFQSNHKTLDARCEWFSSRADLCTKADLERKEPQGTDFNIQSLNNGEEEGDFKIVSVDDICQHVLKSFDIFNARQFMNRKKEKTEPHSPTDTCALKKEDGKSISFQTDQDKFLLECGLKRRSINSN